MEVDPQLAKEAKAIVALVFRNGPLEDLHAGEICPTCHGNPDYSHITDAEMKQLVKTTADRVYSLLHVKQKRPAQYATLIEAATLFTTGWDDPRLTPDF